MTEQIIIAAVFGAILGSFLNVLLRRLPEGESINGRSHCRSCHTTLAWYDLVPIFSFIALRGRCRSCRSKINRQYPLVEAASATTLAIFVAFGPGGPLVGIILGAIAVFILTAIFFFDLLYFLIPDILTMPTIVLFAVYDLALKDYASLATALLLAAFFAILYWVSRGRWLGFGDVKLILMVGLILGHPMAVWAIIFSVWIGAITGMALMVLHLANRKTHLPFGSFIAITSFLLIVFGHAFNILKTTFR